MHRKLFTFDLHQYKQKKINGTKHPHEQNLKKIIN